MTSPPPKPTPEQQHQLDMIKREFGAAMEKSYNISRTTGIMRVRLRAQAGVWNWSFTREGEMVYAHLDMTLFEGTDDDPAKRASTLTNRAINHDDT